MTNLLITLLCICLVQVMEYNYMVMVVNTTKEMDEGIKPHYFWQYLPYVFRALSYSLYAVAGYALLVPLY